MKLMQFIYRPRAPFAVRLSFPVQQEYAPSHFDAYHLFFGGAVISLASILCLSTLPQDQLIGALFFFIIGIAIVAGCIAWMRFKRVVEFSSSGVRVGETNLLGTRVWAAKYGEFLGVGRRNFFGHQKSSTYYYEVIELRHPTEAPIALRVMQSTNRYDVAQKAEHALQDYLATLGLPKLEQLAT